MRSQQRPSSPPCRLSGPPPPTHHTDAKDRSGGHIQGGWLGETPGEDRSVAWLSLDPSDNEPSSFWTYVVTALQTAVPGVGSGALELIASSPLPTDLVLTTLLNELAAAPGEVWLVLDDYHLVDSHDVRDGMTFLLEHLPPHVHVVLSTRADPDLPLARWRVRGELVEIRAADLRFTSDEAATYLNEATGLHLAAGDVEVLEERTEGWIAGYPEGVTVVRVGDIDGQGLFGVLDETAGGLLCHECGWRGQHLGLHVYRAHGLTASGYRSAHGLKRTRGLVTAEIRAVIKRNATLRLV